MKTVILIGPVTRRAGYGEQARFALRSLRANEDRFNILIQDIPWGKSGQVSEDSEEQRYIMETMAKTQQHIQNNLPIDISIQVTIPNEFKKYAPVNIGYTAGIETTRVTPQWIQQAELMDKIILYPIIQRMYIKKQHMREPMRRQAKRLLFKHKSQWKS